MSLGAIGTEAPMINYRFKSPGTVYAAVLIGSGPVDFHTAREPGTPGIGCRPYAVVPARGSGRWCSQQREGILRIVVAGHVDVKPGRILLRPLHHIARQLIEIAPGDRPHLIPVEDARVEIGIGRAPEAMDGLVLEESVDR